MKASEFFLEFTLFAPFAGGVAVGHSRCGEFLLVDDKSLADALHWAMEHRCPVWLSQRPEASRTLPPLRGHG